MKSSDGTASVNDASHCESNNSELNTSILQQSSSPHPEHQKLKIVCLADTHSQIVPIPPGDVLIFGGDLSKSGKLSEIQETITWISSQPHHYKIVIGGNADLALDESCEGSPESFEWKDITYLNRRSVSLYFPHKDEHSRILNVYGDPYVPRCGPNGEEAFQYEIGEDYWLDAVPPETDILVTHTPPKSILDIWDGVEEGCSSLLREVQRRRLLLHVFGHVHPAHGVRRLKWSEDEDNTLSGRNSVSGTQSSGRCDFRETIFVNAACASADGTYMANEPVLIEI